MSGAAQILTALRQLRSQCLFSLHAADLTLRPRTGQVPTLTRASVARAADANGRGLIAGHSAPRWEMVDLDGDGIRETVGLLLERGNVGNLISEPENFSAWTADGTPTLSSGQPDPFGGSAAYLLGDDSAGAVESIRSTIELGSDSAVSASLFLRQDLTAQLMEVGLWDATAIAWRHLVRVNWGGSSPSVPALSTLLGTGVLFPPERWATHNGGWWRIAFNAGLLGASANRMYIYPAGTTVANIASVFAYGAQVEASTFPTSYQGTVLRAPDALSYPIDFGPQALTCYLRYVERGSRYESVEARLLSIGLSGPGTNSLLLGDGNGGQARLLYNNGGNVVSTLASTHTLGALVELFGVLFADGSVQLRRSINGGSLEVGTRSSPAPGGMLAAWDSNSISLQGVPGGARSAVLLHDAKVLPGERDPQDCREAA